MQTTILDIPTKTFGLNINKQVYKTELAVMQRFSVEANYLKDWRYDSEAKLAVCFMLFHLFDYSVSALSSRYRIYSHALRRNLNRLNTRLITDADFRQLVVDLENEIKTQ